MTDNHGLKDATGETVFLSLGAAPTPPAGTAAPDRATTTTLTVKRIRGQKYHLVVRVAPGTATGMVLLRDRRTVLDAVRPSDGVARVKVRLDRGVHKLRAAYLGGSGLDASRSKLVNLRRR